MHVFWKLLGMAATVAGVAGGCSDYRQEVDPRMDDASLTKDLALIAEHHIFFGHQSVGMDIMQGIRDLKAARGISGLRIVSLDRDSVTGGPFFAEALVGRNSEPDSKCDMFENVVGMLAADSLDIALMKFCYVDIKKHTDVKEVFRYYEATMEDLQRKYPRIVFVHVTVPVTERNIWWRRMVKQILGREEEWDLASIKSSEFNRMLLKRFQEEPIFDLAAVESTYPDGTRSMFEAEGKVAYTMVSAYTRDGGHLNERGRELVARELVRTLAAVIRKRSP